MRFLRILAALALLFSPLLDGQRMSSRGSRGRTPATNPDLRAVKGAAGTFNGKLKQLTKSKITLETDDEQTIIVRRSKQTKFTKDGQPIKPSDIDLETRITVVAEEDIDLTLVAMNVSVDPPKPK